MIKKRLALQIYLSYIIIITISITAVAIYSSKAFKRFYLQQTESSLYAKAILFKECVEGRIQEPFYSGIDLMCKNMGKPSSVRLTVILNTGEVIGDSDKNPHGMDNHLNRPEIQTAARTKQKGSSIRHSGTTFEDMMYVAVPIITNGDVTAFVRVSIPLNTISVTLKKVYIKIILVGIIISFLSSIMSVWLSHLITSPLEVLKNWSERLSKGELNLYVPEKLGGSEEVKSLCCSINDMAKQLNEKLNVTIRQKNELEAVLSSMVEGVLAVDTNEKLISVNHAAAKLLCLDKDNVKGRLIHELLRNTELQKFIVKTLNSDNPVEGDILFRNGSERFLQAHGTILNDSRKNIIGALIVLNDVTRIKRLENIRKDFVANVSHELKTPITSIKGFVETLAEGAVKNPEESAKFLAIISKQTDRLTAIIDDLLTLSKIEQDAEKSSVKLDNTNLKQTLINAVEICEIKANEKNITINIDCDENITANINAPLIEQAVVNLIDNAVKYSANNSRIQITAVSTSNQLEISVTDYGCGIGEENIPRLFERFYRADKARSRKLGGTGLGLAIVKHIVQAHNGVVQVESSIGEGSTFKINIPK